MRNHHHHTDTPSQSAAWDAAGTIACGIVATAVFQAMLPREKAEAACAAGIVITLLAACPVYLISLAMRSRGANE